MYQLIKFSQQSNPIINNFPRRSPKRRVFLLVAVALTSLAWQPTARAISSTDTFFGTNTGDKITTGVGDTGFGNFCMHQDTTGSDNTGVGYGALDSNVTGNDNTALGSLSLLFSTGSANTATGSQALHDNSTGSNNTATGFNALFSNTTASNNTAIGVNALLSNNTGYNNTALGLQGLLKNTTGHGNNAFGVNALGSNTTGSNNMATGYSALFFNTSGGANAAYGVNALLRNTTGSGNIGIGYAGGSALTTGSNNIDIANSGVAAESNTIRIGAAGTHQATFIAGISGKVVPGGTSVFIDANGHLGTIMSSARYKQQIKPMEKASEAIFALKPVSFRYKEEFDPEGIPQFGLIAEEVAKVNPDLVARDNDGKIYTVRYEAVNAMLLNEFLKEHQKVEELEASTLQQQKDFQSAITQQQKEIGALAKALKEQAAQIQKVSAKVSLQKPGVQMIAASP